MRIQIQFARDAAVMRLWQATLDETYKWNLQRENCVQVCTKPHVTDFFPKALSYVHGINRGHLMEMIHLINMIHSPVNVTKSRWNASPPRWPRSLHLWKAARRFNLDLSRNLTMSSFLDSVASSLRFSLLFSWAAADRWELSSSSGLVLSSMMSPSEAQSNKWRKGRGWPRWACPLNALQTINTS